MSEIFKGIFQVFIKHRMAKVKCVSHLGPKMIEYILLNTEVKEVTLASRVFQAVVTPDLFSPGGGPWAIIAMKVTLAVITDESPTPSSQTQ